MLWSPSSVLHPFREVLSEGRKIEAVKDRRARNASFARHLNSPMLVSGLENRCTGNRTVGSNPTLSAT
jgi:hypothetical protein